MPSANLLVPRLAGVLSIVLSCALLGCAGADKRGDPALPSEDSSADDPNALVLGAEVALQRGQFLEASKAYVQAALLTDDEDLAEQATRIAHEHGQWTLVQTAAERWLALNQTDEEARRFAGFAALRLYRIDRAAEHLGVLLDTAFINPQAGFLALLPQLGSEATPAAGAAVMQRLASKYPDMTEAHYALAQTAVQADNLALAQQHAEKARQLRPYWAPAGLLLARVQMLRGETQPALATAKQVLDEDKQDSYRVEHALMLLQAGQEAEGRKELNALLSSETVAAVAERALADIEFQLGNREAAAQRYSNLLSSGRFVYESLFYLGAIAESRESWDDATQIYGRVTGGEYAMTAQQRAARIKVQQQGLDAGLKHLEDFAAARSQYRIETIAARAALLAQNGDRAGALALLDSALKEYPDAVELRFARAFQLEDADEIDEAISQMRQLVEDRPGDPVAANALGYTLVDRTRQHRDGLKLIEQALTTTPDNGAVLDSMGWALHRLGRDEEALTHLEHARLRINDPEVELHVGQVLLALGRKDEARQVFEKASQRYPANEDIREQLEKMRK